MKKIVAIVLALVIGLFAFTACNKEKDSNSPLNDYGDYEPVEKFDEDKLKETWSIGEITFANNNKITLPCSVKEFIEKSGLTVGNKNYYEGIVVQPGKTFSIQLEDIDMQVKIECKNLETDNIGYLDGTVVGFSFFNSKAGNRQITVAAGLTVGVTRAEVESALGIPEGNTQEDRMYIYKNKISDTQTIRLNISFNSDNMVNSIIYNVGK